MQSIIVTWDPDTGAEPSNIFDGFAGRVFNATLFDRGHLQFMWSRMVVNTDDDCVIQGWEHLPETGDLGDKVEFLLSTVQRIEYL